MREWRSPSRAGDVTYSGSGNWALSMAEPLASGEVEVPIDGDWIQGGGQFYIEQRAPLPLTVLGITAEVVFGG